jgi:biotin carboxylase
VSDLENYEEVLKGVAFFIHHYGKIHRLESHNEHWLELDARLRLDFNIPGLRPEGMDFIKKKSKMKEKFIEAGLRVARGAKAFTKKEALKFASEVGYPIVAKPDKGVGALGTYKIEKEADFDKVDFDKVTQKSGYFLEEYITGTIVTYDGLVDNAGEIVFASSHEYSTGILEVTSQDTHVYYYSQRVIPEDIEEAGRKIVDVFHLRERFFHFEFFRTKEPGKGVTQTNGHAEILDGPSPKKELLPTHKSTLVCLEVNMRPPGGYTLDMFNYANDVDMYSVWAEMITTPPDFRLKRPLIYTRPYHVCYISRKKHIRYKHSTEEVTKHKLSKTIVFSGNVHPGLALMGDYFFMIRSENLQELLEFNKYIWE